MGPRYEERIWELLGRLSEPDFSEDFFSDPVSFDLFDPELLSLLLTVAMPFFEMLFGTKMEWMNELMVRRPDIRRMTAYEFRAIFLRVAESRLEEPGGQIDAEWLAELEVGFLRLASWEREALRSSHTLVLTHLGADQ